MWEGSDLGIVMQNGVVDKSQQRSQSVEITGQDP